MARARPASASARSGNRSSTESYNASEAAVRPAQASTWACVTMMSGSCGSIRRSLVTRSEEHTSELQSRGHLVCRLLLEKKNLLPGLINAHQSIRCSDGRVTGHPTHVLSV